ncbi:histidine kinase [Maridesulfovibrio bastinii]|uniref:histidine kinase n=1 Tax=Maridesulfovibrio bastinii TaxID=47157 RepID=UPI000420CC4C|nr:histidine kinase [Maridesulfovibrio bastinii]
MSDDDSLVEEFFSEVNDKYYPQVLEGLDLLDEQKISEGFEILSRPLHTIKGVTGFMSGFEPASDFTHHVESFLKKMQSGEVGPEIENIALAIEAVNGIFYIIESLRNSGSYDKAQAEDIVGRLENSLASKDSTGFSGETDISVENLGNASIIRVGMHRLHLQTQRDALCAALNETTEGQPILLDFSKTASIGSAAFEDIAGFSAGRNIYASSMGNICKEVLYSWGFNKFILPLRDDSEFLSVCSKKDNQE